MLYLGSDHAGFKLKEEIKNYLVELGYEIKDFGAFEYNENDDYPDFILPVVKEVAFRQAQGEYNTFGIVFGGSGQGEAMVANRFAGIRAAVLYDYNEDIIKFSREHNDANILSFGARFISVEDAKKAVRLWLETKFSGEERHKRRIEKMDSIK